MGAAADDGAEIMGVLDPVEVENAAFFFLGDGGEELVGGDERSFLSQDADPLVVDRITDFVEFFSWNDMVSLFLIGAPFQ